MRSDKRVRRRRGVMALEGAVVFPVLLILLLGLIVGGLGVFHYQQVSCLAREAARWACVRGGDYQNDTNQSSPTEQEILQQSVLPLATAMDSTRLTIKVEWIDQGTNTAYDWDSAPKDVLSITPQGQYVTNTVRVTVTYVWSPGLLLGDVTLVSVSEVPMAS